MDGGRDGDRGEGILENTKAHLEGVLQTGVAQGFLLLQVHAKLVNVVVGVAAHVADADGEAVTDGDDGHLADGVLLKVLAHEVDGVAESDVISVRQQVFVGHGEAHVEHQDEVADDATLEGCRVPQKATALLGVEVVGHV